MTSFFSQYIIECFVLLTLIVGMFVIMLPDTPLTTDKKKWVLLAAAGLLLLSLIDYGELYISLMQMPSPGLIFLRKLLASLGYMMRPLLVVLPIGIIANWSKTFRSLCILEAANIMVYLLNFRWPLAFWFDEENVFQRGPLGFAPHITALVFLLFAMRYSYKTFAIGDAKERQKNAIVIFIPIAIVIALILASSTSESVNPQLLDPTIAVCMLFYYIFLQSRYVEEYDKLQKKHLNEVRDSLLASQIQPHFLYNTLNTIYYLCGADPSLAADTVDKFSGYLRENMELGASADQMIPFEQEIRHVKAYSDIEMLRFDNIKVEYQLADLDFYIPAITVQPMVENAIRHGVRNKKDGKVLIKSSFEQGQHVIIIADNGIGYQRSVSGIQGMQEEHSGMGINNVRERIEAFTGGKLKIEMVRDLGTTVTISIPDKENLK